MVEQSQQGREPNGPHSDEERIPELRRRAEAFVITSYLALLCLLAAGRIFLVSAAMPLFASADEDAHFDLVQKLARGYWPDNRRQTLDAETARFMSWYASPEFRLRAADIPGGTYPPPLWSLPSSDAREAIANNVAAELEERPSHEAHSPPLYYTIAAVWYKLGLIAGMSEFRAVYWIRFLNIPLLVALIVATYGFCRGYFPRWVALATPLLVACFPSNMFFSITNDIMSPLAVLLAVWLMLNWYFQPESTWRSLGAGLAVAAAILVKLTNVAIIAACCYVVLSRVIRDSKESPQPWGRHGQAILLTLSGFLPVAAWALRNRLVLGDWSGNRLKLQSLHWQLKPWGQMLDHPLFSLAGQRFFWRELVKSFYRGDIYWNGAIAMDYLPVTLFYFFVTAVAAIGIASVFIGYHRRREERGYRAAVVSVLVVFGSAFLLIYLSLRFDFGDCPYPSRELPFFTSGRLIAGTLVPVLVFYVCGIAAITRRNKPAAAGILGVSAIMMLIPQIMFFLHVLKSPYNSFHIH
jgi:hypothetical protein